MDMLVNLYQLPEKKELDNIQIKRVLPPDITAVQKMVQQTFGEGWGSECLPALLHMPSTCYIAVREQKVIGFACYDATGLGYFGPIGLLPQERGNGVGRALLLETLYGMKNAGYGYAVIGWCDDAAPFYAKSVGAVPIPQSDPEATIYQRLSRF